MAKQKRYNGYLRKCFTYNGKKYAIYGKTNDELMEKVFKKKQELKEGSEAIYNPTLNEYYKTFTEIRRKQIKENTIRSQTFKFNNISRVKISEGVIFGEMKIKDISRRDIEIARDKLLESGKTAETINSCFIHLNTVFNSAVIDETIIKNPCKSLKKLKKQLKPISETKHRALSIKETKLFFEEAEKRNSYYKNAFLLMFNTGLRIGELSALYETDIDKINGFLHIRRTISRGETGACYVSENAKTKSGQRDIPLNDQIIKILNNQRDQNYSIFGIDNGLLFRSINNDIIKVDIVNREIKRICNAISIEPFTCHAFRNTFATRFIEEQPQNYKILSEILGHKNVSITLNLYTHVMTENKVNAMKNLQFKIS